MKFSTFSRLLFTVAITLLALKGVGLSMYAMNLKSDLFASLGLFGLIIASAIWAFAIAKTWRKRKHEAN